MPKSPDLRKADANRLAHYTVRKNDTTLTPDQRREARKKRGALMLSLRRAGWPLPPIAAAASITLSVAREQIVVLPPTVKSVEVYNKIGERVLPEPLESEFVYGDMTESEVSRLQSIAPLANQFNFSHGENTPQYKASHMLDVTLAFLYDRERRPTDMARAIGSSNSLVRSRIRRAKDNKLTTKGVYQIPEVIRKEADQMMATI